MPIAAPKIRWPTEFDEKGPLEDPTILLVGQAEIAGVVFVVRALRMREGMRMPDFLDHVPEEIYESATEGMVEDVEDIEDLTDTIAPNLILINAQHYLLWMVPWTRKE